LTLGYIGRCEISASPFAVAKKGARGMKSKLTSLYLSSRREVKSYFELII
jgi:hypothetical protein